MLGRSDAAERHYRAERAVATDECITKVAGLDTVGEHAVRRENTSLLTQMIADLEARLTEPAAG